VTHRASDDSGLPDAFTRARFVETSIYDAPEWYDVDYAGYRAEEAFYRLVCERFVPANEIVVELGAGTGRLTLPLARAGLRMVAVEPASPMRAALVARVAREASLSIDVRAGRAQDFDAGAPAALVMFAFNGLLHMETREALHAAFTHVRGALRDGGRFAFDVTGPYWDAVALGSIGWGRLDERVHHETGKRVFTADRSRYDASTRTMHVDIRYLVEGADQGVQVALTQRMWTWQELLSALQGAGFRVELLFGDVDLSPFHEGAVRMLACAKKV
jgi:SAM-dependent methyltransferase